LRPLRRVGAKKARRTTAKRYHATFAIRAPRDSHRDVAPAIMASFFRFASVVSRPRFSHDPVNLAPDCDG
jgi:hypothetical protein